MWFGVFDPGVGAAASPPPVLLNILYAPILGECPECPQAEWCDPGLLESPVQPVRLSIVWLIFHMSTSDAKENRTVLHPSVSANATSFS